MTHSHSPREDGGGAPAFASLHSPPEATASGSASSPSLTSHKDREESTTAYLDSPSEMIRDQTPSNLKGLKSSPDRMDAHAEELNTGLPSDDGAVFIPPEVSYSQRPKGASVEPIHSEPHSSGHHGASSEAASDFENDLASETSLSSMPNDLSTDQGQYHPEPSNAITENSTSFDQGGHRRKDGNTDLVHAASQGGTLSSKVSNLASLHVYYWRQCIERTSPASKEKLKGTETVTFIIVPSMYVYNTQYKF